MLRVTRPVAASFISLAVVSAATGWLYMIQPRSALPGPPVSDALPLDELSRRSAVPLLVFLAVWITAALLLGLIAWASRAERLTAGLMLALGVGGWAYVTTGLSMPPRGRKRSTCRQRSRDSQAHCVHGDAPASGREADSCSRGSSRRWGCSACWTPCCRTNALP